jgi:RNA polymerase sigma-70 factor (ECF subfamily)
MLEDEDRELILRCQGAADGDPEQAFAELYGRHKDTVYGIAYRVCGDRTEALDAAQEAFLVLYRKLGTFAFESKFTSWLYRLVVNASIDHLRRSRRRPAGRVISLDRFASREESSRAADERLGLEDNEQLRPVQRAEAEEEEQRVHAAIQELSPKLRIVTVLRYQQQLSYEEIAETLELSLGTVKSRLSRAHLALAEFLSESDDDAEAEGPTARESEAR